MAELNIADVISNHRRGSHVVILQIPFEFEGKKYQAIELGPFTLDHRLMWRDGVYKTPFDLMCAVCHEIDTHKRMDPLALRQLCNPDDERLEQTFMSMLPHEMREGVIKNQWPGTEAPAAVEDEEIEPPRRIRPAPEQLDEEFDEPMQEDRGLDLG